MCAPQRAPLRYRDLAEQVDRTGHGLRGAGLGPEDRVAIVLPNGPAMASAFACIAPWCAAAPLNPAYKADEFDFYLSDLNAKALIVAADMDSGARDVATRRGVRIIELVEAEAAGAFVLDVAGEAPATPRPEDAIALILHTSGTTSRPKMVPLTQANLCASAANIANTLALGPSDTCLNVMPLFHIHGLMAPVLASLASGGSVYCTPGFDALRFFRWLTDADPTWYSAVPTMHQAILARVPRNRERVDGARLRFIRSASAALPAQVMTALEEAFDAPVLEAYAMTEAAHQMCSNPLPPAPRKPGMVGPAAGPEVAIMNEVGEALPTGVEGEIVIRGANVMSGYLANPEADATAFHGAWFRTGDLGFLDTEGYLKVTGRLKEIINRGGEKIAPLEVDEVLLDHPGVAQVVTFALPHPRLGEDVAAAVVRVPDQPVDEGALREFAARRLADFKVPRTIVFVDEIPKGPTGKIQRIGLAAALGLDGRGRAGRRRVRVCVYGAGAIGGYLAVRLARAGAEVSVVARGPHLAAIQERGLALVLAEERLVAHLEATSDASTLGAQDYVVLTLKAHSIPGVVPALQPLLGDDTAVVSAVNGIPWWYFHGLDSPHGERHVDSVDPGGVIWRGIGPERVIGCVVYPSCEVVEPGVVRHLSDDKFSLGEPSGARSDRVREFAALCVEAGIKAPVRPRLRDEIWVKLWGNLAFNPLSALTGATLDVLATEPDTRRIARAMMMEAQAVGEALGARFAVDVERRIDGAAAVGAHRTSMLQDLERGRPLENEALVGAVQELARLTDVPTPTIDLVHALLRQRVAFRD